MKLLLTSGGISNRAIAKALYEFVGKDTNGIKVGYVPIAANVEPGNKDWIIKDFLNFWRYGYNNIDIIDPSAAGVGWQGRLAEVDVVMLSGGNTFHLLDQARQTGFDDWLKENLQNKVYVGSSASSILLGQTIELAGGIDEYGDENLPGLTDLTGLGLVDFEVAPHVPSWTSYESVEKYAHDKKRTVYALDDQSAIKVDGQNVEVVSDGQWKLFKGDSNGNS
jgi:dipeptidase E